MYAQLGKVTTFPCWMGITEFAVQMFHEEFDVQKDYPVYAKDGYIGTASHALLLVVFLFGIQVCIYLRQ